MRVYDTNLFLIRNNLEMIYNCLEYDAYRLSQILGRNLHSIFDLGMIKDNNEFIKIAKALNVLGIGIVPYEYRYKQHKYPNTNYKGFTDFKTKI